MQNHFVLLIFKPFAFFAILNLITGVLAVPFLLTKLFGVETAFSQSLPAMLNTTFFAAILGLAYLCLDPILKAIYLLRCFYGESLTTGRDLKAELKRVQLTLGVVFLFLVVPAGFSTWAISLRDGPFSPLPPALSPLRGEGEAIAVAGTPSPLNGERAGVRGENVKTHRNLLS